MLANSALVFLVIYINVFTLFCRPLHVKLHGRFANTYRFQMSRVDEAMSCTYDKLAEKAIEIYETNEREQVWICIAGGPGSGKSTLSEEVCNRIKQRLNNDTYAAIVIPMDGFHYSRAELRDISKNSNGALTYDDLLARRGSPWTFDAKKLVQSIESARKNGAGRFPVYSRKLSDPVPDGVELMKSHKIVIVEGNYLLNYEDEDWAKLRGLFDEKWFLSCRSSDDQRERLIRRHLETWTDEKTKIWGADGREGAARKADANDVINAQFIETTKKFADLIIESI